jgi:Nif-specific regulatory protein
VRGSIIKAANQLGVTERTMGLRIKKYNIQVQNYKNLTNGSIAE